MTWEDIPNSSVVAYDGASSKLSSALDELEKRGAGFEIKADANGNPIGGNISPTKAAFVAPKKDVAWEDIPNSSAVKPTDTTGMSSGRADLEKIQPTVKSAPEPKLEAKSMLQKYGDALAGGIETPITLGTGMVGQAVGGVAGILSGLMNGYGTTAGAEAAAKLKNAVAQQLTYEPRSDFGKKSVDVIGNAMEKSGIAGINPSMMLNEIPAASRALSAATETPIAAKPLTQSQDASTSAIANKYVLPPTQVNPTPLNRIVEGWAGKWNLSQEAAIKNQPITNDFARSAIGVTKDAPLDFKTLDAVREQAAAPYRAIKALDIPIELDETFGKKINGLLGDYSQASKRFPDLYKNDQIANLRDALLKDPLAMAKEPLPGTDVPSIYKTLDKVAIDQPQAPILKTLEQAASELHPHGYGANLSAADRLKALPAPAETAPISMSPAEAIELVKTLRFRASNRLSGAAFDNPENRALGMAEREAANAIDSLMERTLTQKGQGDLATAYRQGRQRIAQTYDIQAALNDTTGNVDARKISFLAKKRPFSGALSDIAEFGDIGKKVAMPPETFGGHPGVNPLDLGLAGVQMALGKPGAAMRGIGIATGRPLMAKVGTSDWYQNRFVSPKTESSPLGRMSLNQLADLQSQPIASLAEISAANRNRK